MANKRLVEEYQRDFEPDGETRRIIEERVGASWREDQGVAGRSYILKIIKEEWGNIKPTSLRIERRTRSRMD